MNAHEYIIYLDIYSKSVLINEKIMSLLINIVSLRANLQVYSYSWIHFEYVFDISLSFVVDLIVVKVKCDKK